MPRINSPPELDRLQAEITAKRDPSELCISVSSGTCGQARGSEDVYLAIQKELRKQGSGIDVHLRKTGCLGFCERAPLVIIYPEEIFYSRVTPEDTSEIVRGVREGETVARLLYTDPTTGEKAVYLSDIPFYQHQERIILEANRWLDPNNIEDYVSIGGYAALCKALYQMNPDEVIEEIAKAKLRGRGGGGFPTARKWRETKNAPREPKYVIVNCDEGDPGAYMDRALMEGNPHRVLEGLIIGAYAIGSPQGYVYIRQEYPLAYENLIRAIHQAEEYGFLGDNILGSGLDLRVTVHRGAGAFVSGESSALMAAIEGRVGEPKMKYIHTAVNGIKGKPSCLNNVETWANVPLIITRGGQWFSSIGTEESKGTKIFSLVGKVNNTGLVEVPMGMTLRKLIYDVGGGVPRGRTLKAVQTGGPSGGIIPADYLDTTIDFEELSKLGSMMGSGGLVIMDEDSCMVDIARYFVSFCCEESCGKCIPCREGLRVLRRILNDICQGKGEEADLEMITDIAETMKKASLCALGTTAVNPILTSLEYFGEEYLTHIKEKRCPVKVCNHLASSQTRTTSQ
jgi:NADH-quinone oxidoreductase subunit F